MRKSAAAIASRWAIARDLERITESEPMPRRAGSLDDRARFHPLLEERNGCPLARDDPSKAAALESVQAHSPLPCAYHRSFHHVAHQERMAKRDCAAMNLDPLTAFLSAIQSSAQHPASGPPLLELCLRLKANGPRAIHTGSTFRGCP